MQCDHYEHVVRWPTSRRDLWDLMLLSEHGYEAGPTGLGLYRAANAAGLAVEVDGSGQDTQGPSSAGLAALRKSKRVERVAFTESGKSSRQG